MKSIVLLFISTLVLSQKSNKIEDEEIAQDYMNFINRVVSQHSNEGSILNFNFETNVTDENEAKLVSEN